MTDILYTRDRVLSDDEILSFWQMIFAPAQRRWDFEDNSEYAQWPAEKVIHFFRNTVLVRETGHAYWARKDGQIIGMASLNQFTEPAKIHCAELGFSVRESYQRCGIGYQLVCAVLDKARTVGLARIECSCLADNAPAIGLLCKAGFRQEGLRIGAIWKCGQFRDIHEFGLLL